MRDLIVTGNKWWSERNPDYKNDTIIVQGRFDSVFDTIIESNVADAVWNVKSTRATASVTVKAGVDRAVVGFGESLLFPDANIAEAFCSVQTQGYLGHSLAPLQGLSVTVFFSRQAAAETVVTCTVDQSTRTHPGH